MSVVTDLTRLQVVIVQVLEVALPVRVQGGIAGGCHQVETLHAQAARLIRQASVDGDSSPKCHPRGWPSGHSCVRQRSLQVRLNWLQGVGALG